MTLSRRSFLGWLAGTAALGGAFLRPGALSGAGTAGPGSAGGGLRRDPRYPRRGFADFPTLAGTGVLGAGTYGLPDSGLLLAALEQGARLVDTSPDYRNGNVEEAVGWAVQSFPEPFFIMTQIPVADWEEGSRRIAFHRSLRRSLGRLRRGDVEALLVRNAEPGQLRDPEFRAFATDVKASGIVRHIGASGHGPDLEKVLEIAVDDDLIGIVLFGAHLAGFQRIPELLGLARSRGKILVAMKTREAALWADRPGWEAEAARRRHEPWNGRWDPAFSRAALRGSLEETGAANALVSLRTPEDVALLR